MEPTETETKKRGAKSSAERRADHNYDLYLNVRCGIAVEVPAADAHETTRFAYAFALHDHAANNTVRTRAGFDSLFTV